MANISNSLDSMFDDGLGFDTIFDQEDKLIDTVNGVKEDGSSFLGDPFEALEEGDAQIVSGDVGRIPGEPTTDDGPGGHEAVTKKGAKTDSEGKEVPGSHEHNAYPDSTTPAQFRSGLGYSRESADLDDLLLDESSTFESEIKEAFEEILESCKSGKKASKKSMKDKITEKVSKMKGKLNIKEAYKSALYEYVDTEAALLNEFTYAFREYMDENADLDDLLIDESYLDLDDYMLDESGDGDDFFEEGVDWFGESDEEVDPEEELINAVDNNEGGDANLEYEAGIDDEIIDDII